ncbi:MULTISPECIES: hypothetical protein [Caloramator]|uniref:Uncharacterized protein n=1 Tax=Caloramator proteoclasticus DSM 10124 TaxID=1121262 RepID=A0A1M4XHE2_9CLOT|nr:MULTISPECIES: hypothetical protein [Caloramator]SHE92925.1 hypothetical protein SAMN02746091_01412 [Caloramator proteoclasticus DSM 10124]
MIQNISNTFNASSCMMANIIKSNSPELKQVGSIFYLQPQGIQFVGVTAYITEYVNIGSNVNALA